MLLWGFWVLAALLDPAQLSPAQLSPTRLAFTLVAVTAAMLVVAVVALPVFRPGAALGVQAFARRARTAARPRLADPDAAGRPRSRAPSVCPAAA